MNESFVKAIQEIEKQAPGLRKPLVVLFVQEKERMLLMLESMKDVVEVEGLALIRSFIATTFSLIAFTWLAGKIWTLLQWIERTKTIPVTLPAPFTQRFTIDLSPYIPTSTALEAVGRLPAWNQDLAWKMVIAILILLLIEKAWQASRTWYRGRMIRNQIGALKEELTWLKKG